MESLYNLSKKLSEFYEKNNLKIPSYHFVLGSGYQESFFEIEKKQTDWEYKKTLSFKEIGLKSLTALGHKGEFSYYENKKNKKVIVFQLGRIHLYENASPLEVVSPVGISALSGVKNFVITNAAGCIDKNRKVGDLMNITDHINFTSLSPLTGLSDKNYVNFTDLSKAYSQKMASKIKEVLIQKKLNLFDGIYLGLNGPQFETPAEIKAFRNLGASAVGMSTVLEVIFLNYLKVSVCGFSLMSNMACGILEEKLDAYHVITECKKVAPKILEAFFEVSKKG